MNHGADETQENSRAGNLQLLPVDRDNIWDIIDLEVAKKQRSYVLTNAVSIAQAHVQPELIPLAICDGKRPVGFLMYGIDENDGEYWLYRLMVGEKQQRRGYGEAAIAELLETVRKDRRRKKMFLGVDPRSEEAVNLFHRLGFRFDGRVFGKEHVMALEW